MALTDPIADLLTRFRNAKMAKHRFLDIDSSGVKLAIVKVLKEQGLIESYLVNEDEHKLRIFLKYDPNRECLVQGLKRISSPGLRRYVGYQDIPRILGGLGIAILSTPKGVVDGETARKMKVGGELLCLIW